MNTLDLDTLTLAAGSHDPGDEMCPMEAVAFIAGEEWTDRPECASPVIGAFVRASADALNDDDRQELKRYILRLVGSRGTPEQEDLRGWMALDWLVRVHTPAWLRLAGLTDQADRLAGLAEIRPDTVPGIKPALDAAHDAARAAAAGAAWDVAGAAAGDPARVAALAAREAARAATHDAAGAAARDAARDTAALAAWDAWAAWDTARDAAEAAALAAEAAERDAGRDAAYAAAWAALDVTRRELQQSAHDLVDRMLAVTEGDPA